MTWPWVSRRTFERAEACYRAAATELAHLAQTLAAREQECISLERQNIELRADNKLLLDRIVQMSGQPPIFHPVPIVPPTPAEAKAAESSALPAPTIRRSPDDVKRMAREAISRGDFDKPKAAVAV